MTIIITNVVLRLWKFTEHHSGSPKISYFDKCVFQVRFPHQCITGIVRVPGCESLSWPLFFCYFFILNISSTTNSTTMPPPPQCHKVYNHSISTNITRLKRPFALKKNDPPLQKRTTLPESHPKKKTDLMVGVGPSKRRKHIPISLPRIFPRAPGREGRMPRTR